MSIQNRPASGILPLHTDWPGFCVTIIDQLAKVTNVHSKPTSQWHIAIAHRPARILCHHYRPTGRGNKCPFKTDWPVAYIAIAHRPAGIFVTITDRLAKVINVHSKLTGQWHIAIAHRPAGIFVTITVRLAKVINVHSKPTSQWHIAIAHRPAGILCHHYRPTGQGNKCLFKTDWPVGFCVTITDQLAKVINVHSKPTGQWHILPLHTDRPGFLSPLQTDWPR